MTHKRGNQRYVMTRFMLAISLLPLAFVVGCGDPNSGDNGGNTECTDADCVDDTDFAATIIATTPFAGVQVTVDGTDADCVGTTCTFSVADPGEYEVEAWDTYTFIPKEVQVDNPGEFQVSWSTGGCASDPDWNADGPCDEWVPGEYGFPPLEGSYTDEEWGSEWDVEVNIDNNIVLEMGSVDPTMSAENFYWSNSDVGTWVTGTVIDEETFSMVMLNASGTINEFLFHRD